MRVAIATIYFLNYKDAVAEAWKKVARLPRASSRRVCERRGREVLKTFRDRTRLLREAKPCSIMGLRARSSLPPLSLSRLFLRYIRLESRLSFQHFQPENFAVGKKIVLKFVGKFVCGREMRDAVSARGTLRTTCND